MVVLFDSREVLLTFRMNTSLKIFLDPIVADNCIRSQIVLRHDVNAILAVLSNLVHHDLGVR